ncbi:hypothetical protein [Domibacillus sp. A3M-37]|uniref:flagellin N-terminal helical domain-containing protein n=1 Tax=Domibacillus sp. A3M-37 TaxID=2962037 RepID=UPI0035BF7DAC
MEKLSSGLRINKAGDDAAGLAISEKMRGQIRGLDMASKNAQDGISMIKTAEGALNETHDILQRMRELATQAANDTNTETDRGEIQKEIDQLVEEVDRISGTTEFNTQKLLDGSKDTQTAFSSIGGDNVDFSGLSFPKGSYGLTDATHTISVDYTAGQAASSFDGTQNATPVGTPTGSGNITLDGDYTGATDKTLTVSYAAATEFNTATPSDGGSHADAIGDISVTGTYTGSQNTLTVTYNAAGTDGGGNQTAGVNGSGGATNTASALSFGRDAGALAGDIDAADAGAYQVQFSDATNYTVFKSDGSGGWTTTGVSGTAGGGAVNINGIAVTVAAGQDAVPAPAPYDATTTMNFSITADTQESFDVSDGNTTHTAVAFGTNSHSIEGSTVDLSNVTVGKLTIILLLLI